MTCTITTGIRALRIPKRKRAVSRMRMSALSGTGLGLSIAKELAEAHGGTITVTSKASFARGGGGMPSQGSRPAVRRASADPASRSQRAVCFTCAVKTPV